MTEEAAERRSMGIGAVTATYQPDYLEYGTSGRAKVYDFYSRLSEAAEFMEWAGGVMDNFLFAAMIANMV